MTQEQLKILFDDPNLQLAIGFTDKELYKKVLILLLKNGYTWRSATSEQGIDFFSSDSIILNINYIGDRPKILSFIDSGNNYPFLNRTSTFIMNDEIYKWMERCINKAPDYKPKKFSREI